MFIKMWKLSSRSFRKSRNYKNFILIFKYQKKPIKLKTDKKIKYKKQTKFQKRINKRLKTSEHKTKISIKNQNYKILKKSINRIKKEQRLNQKIEQKNNKKNNKNNKNTY